MDATKQMIQQGDVEASEWAEIYRVNHWSDYFEQVHDTVTESENPSLFEEKFETWFFGEAE